MWFSECCCYLGEWCSTNISWILLILHNLDQTLLFGLLFNNYSSILWRTLNCFFFFFGSILEPLSVFSLQDNLIIFLWRAVHTGWLRRYFTLQFLGHKFVYSLCLSLLFLTLITAVQVMQAALQNDANPDLALAVDIWSLGCTIIEMLNGKPPWSDFTGVRTWLSFLPFIHHYLGL